MPASGRRLLALFVLALWIGPMCGAVGVGLHVALDDHHRHDHHDGHEGHAGLPDLDGTTGHGHSHDLDAATDHGHEATVQVPSPVRRQGPPLTAAFRPQAPPGSATAADAAPKPPPRDGPSDPLFKTHCTLLL